MSVNIIVLAIASMGMAYVAAQFVKTKNGIGVILNLMILVLCFISGTFIPQYLLGDTAEAIAAFTPTYWYIRGNDLILELQYFEPEILLEIGKCFAIQFAFAIALFCLSLVIERQKEIMEGEVFYEG